MGARGYITDPAAIYAASFATIAAEADLSALPEALRPVAVRLIHACGMVDLVGDLAWTADVVDAARAALGAGAEVLVDAEMVAHGILKDRVDPGRVVRTLNAEGVAEEAKARGQTRSAVAVERWRDRLDGAVVAIGNAPTALFRLIEMIETGAPRPAAVLAFPVGFVGAAESKALLADLAPGLGLPFLTVRGRRGGSAMAAAAVNACAAPGDGP